MRAVSVDALLTESCRGGFGKSQQRERPQQSSPAINNGTKADRKSWIYGGEGAWEYCRKKGVFPLSL